MRHGWKYIVTAFLGAASLVVSGAVAQATVLGPDPSEGPTTGGTVVTLPVPGAPQEAPFTEVSVGEAYSLALDTQGRAWAWGRNQVGQLGNGSTWDADVPRAVTMPPGVTFKQVSAGDTHSLALDTDGKAWEWGQGMYGQLGIDSTEDALTPVEVPMPAGMLPAYVYAGHLHSLAIDTQGDAWAWGSNFHGQLGDGSSADSDVPVPVRMPGADATVMVTEVLFGDALGEGLTDNGDGTVSVTTPAHAPGAVDVTLGWTVNGVVQEPVVYPDGFTFVEPAVVPTVTDPADVSVVEGSDAAFTVTVTGTPEPDLQWEIRRTAVFHGRPWLARPARR